MAATSKPNANHNYQREFWLMVARSLPHYSLLLFSKRVRANTATALLSKRPQQQLAAQSSLKSYPPAARTAYIDVAKHARLWHGTGRFQYAHGKVIDVLDSILVGGSLNPMKDVYGIFVGEGEMITISTTPLRIIARSYADTHGKGIHEPHRYGTSLWWVAYYYSLFYGLVFTRYSITVLRNISKWKAASKTESGEIAWGKKVNVSSTSVWDTFGSGSDIPGNFPILFGITRYGQSVKLPKIMEKAEVRLREPVRVSDLSHIEVPEQKVDEVRHLLAKHNLTIPVFPLELGEYVASKQPFASLLGITQV